MDVIQDQAAITDEMLAEARALIGVELRITQPVTEAAPDIMAAFAKGIGSRNPLYTSPAYAANTFFGGLIGHPTFLHCVHNTLVAPKLAGVHAVYGGADWEFHLPVRAWERLKASAKLTAVERKTGRFCGEMVLQEGRIEYRNQRDALVATVRSLVLRTPRPTAREAGKYQTVTKYRYSADEIEGIFRSYDAEEVRNWPPRYWEDVVEGEALTPVVKGPLTSEDMLQFLQNVRGLPFLGDWTRYRQRHPAAVYWDPFFNMPDAWEASLFKDSVAREFGFPAAHDTGIQRVCWLENLVTNWTGDLGFLKRLSVRVVRPNIFGDTTWCKGKVTRRYRDSGRYLADIELWAENQRGEVTATGQAVAALCSRDPESLPPTLAMPGAA